jgi:hypothetical protein
MEHVMEKEKKGTGEKPWTPAEKSPDPTGQGGSAKTAGEAEAKGRPTDDRGETETAAARTERDRRK